MKRTYCLTTLFPLTLIVCLGLVRCSQSEKEQPVRMAQKAIPHDSLVIVLQGDDSLTVLELLELTHEVNHFVTAGGAFVRAIDSVYSSDDFFWIYSVNDSMPDMAADQCITGDSDIVKWHFRRIGK